MELQLVTYRYTIREQEGVKIVDDAPAYHKIVPHLLLIPKKATLKEESILYFNHYDDVYKWCNDKIAQTQNDLGVVSKFTQQLIDTCKTDDEKISLIFAWVQYNIRYIAFEYGLDRWIPDNAQNVLRKKYGDCKGMSNLLRIMLQSAGFDARLVWIGTDGLSNKEVPLPLFNHVICALFKDNRIIYLDPTVKYMVPGEYHDAIQGCSTLIENGYNYIVDAVPEISPAQNTDSLRCVYSIEGNSLVGNVDMVLSGECKQTILSMIYTLESYRRKSTIKQFLEKGKSQEKVSDIFIQGEDSKHNQLSINYNAIRENSVNRIGDVLYIDLDCRKDCCLTFGRNLTIEYRSINGAPQLSKTTDTNGNIVLTAESRSIKRVNDFENIRWFSPLRDLPIIRFVVLQNASKTFYKPVSARAIGAHENVPYQTILEDAKYYLMHYKSFQLLVEDIRYKVSETVRSIWRREPNITKVKMANLIYTALNYEWTKSKSNYPPSAIFILTLTDLFKEFGINSNIGFATYKNSARIDEVLTYDDFVYLVAANNATQYFFPLTVTGFRVKSP